MKSESYLFHKWLGVQLKTFERETQLQGINFVGLTSADNSFYIWNHI